MPALRLTSGTGAAAERRAAHVAGTFAVAVLIIWALLSVAVR